MGRDAPCLKAAGFGSDRIEPIEPGKRFQSSSPCTTNDRVTGETLTPCECRFKKRAGFTNSLSSATSATQQVLNSSEISSCIPSSYFLYRFKLGKLICRPAAQLNCNKSAALPTPGGSFGESAPIRCHNPPQPSLTQPLLCSSWLRSSFREIWGHQWRRHLEAGRDRGRSRHSSAAGASPQGRSCPSSPSPPPAV